MDDPAFEYALRVAALQALIENRAHQTPAPPTPGPSIERPSLANTPSRKSYTDGGGSGYFTFDLSSLMGRDGKSPKFPEKLLKVLDEKLQRVAMGQEPKYSEQRFRRTAAAFWSSTWAEKTFQRNIRESRKIEDLILPFVTAATKSLKKDEELADGAWKFELNNQISVFLEMLASSLNSVGPISAELSSRLDGYRARLKATPANGPPERDKDSVRSVRDSATLDGRASPAPSHVSRKSDVSFKGKATDGVARLWDVQGDELARRLKDLQGVCTEQAALDDLKAILKLLNTDSPFPYGPSDFASNEAWASYRSAEVSTLSQMMLLMMQANPALVQSSDRTERYSNGDLTARVDRLSMNGSASPKDSPFTYIPPDPRHTYRALLDKCLECDLEVLKTLPEDEDVSLGVLSPEHVALLGECAVRWRLPQSFRAWVFLDAIVDRCESGAVPSACVMEAMGMLAKTSQDMPIDTWALPDRDGVENAFLRRDICFLSAVESALIHAPKGYHSPDFAEAVEDWRSLEVTSVEHPSLERAATSIAERIRVQAYKDYIAEASARFDHEGGKTRAFALAMASWVEKEVKKLNKKFLDPICDKVDVVPLVIGQQITLWLRDLEDSMATPPPEGQEDHDSEETFALYKKSLLLVDMANAFLPEPLTFNLTHLFAPTVTRWLDETVRKTREWADSALAVDSFEPVAANGPSSSVTDLFDSFRSASKFLMDLGWADEKELAGFATRLSKTFSLSIHDYCTKMEQAFAFDMASEVAVPSAPAPTAKQKAWLEKAKSTIATLQEEFGGGGKKIVPFFNFTPASCVKLNNIEAARTQLDKLYQDMRVDDLAAYDTDDALPPPDQQNYLFTVKIVLAEGLQVNDLNSKLADSFVILSDEHGNRYAKTRTIYDDNDPRWDETFDIPVKGSAWFMATIRHRNLAGKHDLLGRAYLRLDPSQYADLISKDVLLPLDTRGHILLRISMEGERDDIQFHFGRAFRWLKRTESDMVRTFVDKMNPVLRHTLSRASIKSVLKPEKSGPALDYNQALDKLSAAYRQAMGTPEFSIPLPASEKPRLPKLTDAMIESAIHPLFDYLEANNSTLAGALSPDAMQSVMAKLWKQILMTVEGLIVPPLSDKPSLMRALSDGELDIALKWLKFLRDFFYAGGEGGIPLNVLQNSKFNEILSVRIYYDWSTDDLMEECIKGFQTTLKQRASKPSKSLLSQRNLGTIRARKTAKRAMTTSAAPNNTEMIMRILRMRQGTQEFLAQQIQTISVVKFNNPDTKKSIRVMNNKRFSR